MTDTTESPALDRRRILGGAAAVGLGGPLLAACGDDTTSSSSGDGSPEPSSESPEGSEPTDKPADEPAAAGLVATADVPVGGGVVVEKAKVVVTQPADGDFKAFSAVCTHQGCLVTSVSDDTISCPCHGSQFSATDGSVKSGPAGAPLAPVKVTVEGDQVVAS